MDLGLSSCINIDISLGDSDDTPTVKIADDAFEVETVCGTIHVVLRWLTDRPLSRLPHGAG